MQRPLGALDIVVENVTGSDLIELAVVGLKDPALNPPEIAGPELPGQEPPADGNKADRVILSAPVLQADQASDQTDAQFLAITRQPIAAGKVGRAWVMGLCWARIEIEDESHKHARATDGDTTKLTSVDTDSGVPIVWQPGGTGNKWCMVLLGGASAKAEAKIEGAFAIIKGTVPAASGIDVSGPISEGQSVFTPGRLAANRNGSTFVEGALIVNPDGTAVFEPEPGVEPVPGEDPPLVPKVVDAINCSYTDFVGGDGVAIGGADVTYRADGDDDDQNVFAVPAFDFRSLPGFVEGEVQIPFHPAGADGFSLDGEDCEGT